MPNPQTPADYGTPNNDIAQYVPLAIQYIEDGSVPIFWGDNQIVSEEGDYENPSNMTIQSILSIPKVVRFLYTYDDDSDVAMKNNNNTARDNGPPAPTYTWRSVVQWGEMAWLKTGFRATSGLNYLVYPFIVIDSIWADVELFDVGIGPVFAPGFGPANQRYDSVEPNGIWPPSGAADGGQRVNLHNTSDGTSTFLGSIRDCPIFEFPVYRSVTWYRKRTDNGFEEFISGMSALSPPGTSGTQAPRKSFSSYPDGVTMSEYPPNPPYNDVP